jgi:hypothetical protein
LLIAHWKWRNMHKHTHTVYMWNYIYKFIVGRTLSNASSIIN